MSFFSPQNKMRCLFLLVVALCLDDCWGRRLLKNTAFNSSALSRYAKKRTMASTTPKYYGCFEGSRLSFQTTQLNMNNNNDICQEFCKNAGYMFSATHKETCGCFSKHPLNEVSGPQHGADTVRVMNDGKKCNIVCPGKKGVGQCLKEANCCGGDLTYTVYQVGGVNKKRCSTALLEELQKNGVDLAKSTLPTQCPEPASKRTEMSKDCNGIVMDPSTIEKDEKCDENYDTLPKPWACCSPCCDWLVKFLCIDGTVVKCIDK
ncbi:uncharacterized protein LOC116307966 [Actinia tenebrosa]|uniref:Uncharacterized protein LOC116307966 n=1 Tax=Actinia tenebrosa TaxID=6105 RepID=A0A6P8J3H5_ACTTE|nr:uncharacterized protein LOC116307966 [Actinia tenebrosa]